MKEKNPRYSEPAKTGHTIFLTHGFWKNPICPHHGKRAILREPYDEIGCARWFCIDCVAKALYEISRENRHMRRILKVVGEKLGKQKLKELLKCETFNFKFLWHPVSGEFNAEAVEAVRNLFADKIDLRKHFFRNKSNC